MFETGKARASYWHAPADRPDPDSWLAQATLHDGSWWPAWAHWLIARSEADQPAPRRLGSSTHPAIQAAPGSYVNES